VGQLPTTDQAAVDYLPVSLVAEIAYCPRNFYYRMVEAWDDVTSADMVKGKLEDEKREARKTVSRPDSTATRSEQLSSQALGLIAVVDAVEERTGDTGEVEVCPIEYKTGAQPIADGEGQMASGVTVSPCHRVTCHLSPVTCAPGGRSALRRGAALGGAAWQAGAAWVRVLCGVARAAGGGVHR
jgi:hypothetical protein